MNCLRCNSPMYAEIYDHISETQGQGFPAMHCLMCGDIVDPVILKHRQARVEPRGERARDPAKYPNPDALDVSRHNAGTHLAFGAGIHHCIGANLAREEMVLTFAALLRRARDFAFEPGRNDFSHHPSMILRGLKRLYITFAPRRD